MNEFFWTPNEPAADWRQERTHLAKLAAAVCAIPVLTFAAQIVLILILRLVFPAESYPLWISMVLNSVSMYMIAMPVSYLIFRSCKAEPIEKKKLGPLAFLGLLSICFALTMAGGLIGNLLNSIISMFTGNEITNPVESMIDGVPTWLTFLTVAVAAPLLEELFFRKLVIDRLRRYGDLPAIIVSGVLFGLIHGNFSQFFYAALLGIVFGAVYCQTGRLRYTIALHMIINFFGSVYSLEMLKAMGDMSAGMDLTYILEHIKGFLMLGGYYLLYGIAFLGCIPSAILLIRKMRLQKVPSPYSGEDWRNIVLGNPCVWILLVVLLSQFVLNLFAA